MTKTDLADYLANLSMIMDFHEKLGTTKNPYITSEFAKAHDDLVNMVKKEKEDAERSRHPEPVRAGPPKPPERESELRGRYSVSYPEVQPAGGSNKDNGNKRSGPSRG